MIQDRTARAITLTDGRMTIGGVPGRFVQGIGRHLRIEADQLRIVSAYQNEAGSLRENGRIEGDARIAGDVLARAGFEGAAGEIGLVVRPIPGAGEARMLLTLGYQDDDRYVAELWAPPTLVDALRRDILSGAAQQLSLTATTSLWVREDQRDASPALPVTWYLGLEADGARSTSARGLVESIDWTSVPAAHRSPEPPLPQPDESELPDDAVADEVRRLNWSLKQLIIVLVFLLIIVAMK